ncbi:hypothetical protein NF27_CG01010 [Candidatus Jidaibacter acanthamoeba]|uniref:Uncharacterized protein n=1 Tax=Candidatus Jidaibacter acanthamoebae TaxID=86105 RepID=A0A0C1N0S5_9RICK|nr:hypothetical protein NF27_CG01010 [Candidatus Jidaibacter acanthamoeba]
MTLKAKFTKLFYPTNIERVKNGNIGGKQRYKGKSCGKNYREGDLRERYTNEQRLRVKWYLEGARIMSIERIEGVPNPL